MDARSFITEKHNAAVEQLRAIEAEYLSRKESALASIKLTQMFLDELSQMQDEPEVAEVVRQQTPKAVIEVVEAEIESSEEVSDSSSRSNSSWVSARDLLPKVRQTA